ncbi:hypothetical protein BDZ85DRAFT_256657 [Elsinoe ampelina]|uniref:WW domain-containing protein n=1 Tax=Elsinoe ampelina TaxID=302913 RepID=A0A6A6GLS9_9PEZI|nr:hypothetical protein BDZ85DRAFT_256657 [Elsinoe ampelina]
MRHTHPVHGFYTEGLPPQWEALLDANKVVYYQNHETKTTSSAMPHGFKWHPDIGFIPLDPNSRRDMKCDRKMVETVFHPKL